MSYNSNSSNEQQQPKSRSEKNLILALNAGSSSLKASLMRFKNQGEIDDENHNDDDTPEHVFHVLGERLGTERSCIHFQYPSDEKKNTTKEEPRLNHHQVVQECMKLLNEHGYVENVMAIGHRVVHGGTLFSESTLVDSDDVLERMKSLSHLAPLHNPSNMAGIKLMRDMVPHIPNVAVFDTSFHSTMPEKAYTYPLPLEYREAHMRKFGFHGTSVHYVSRRAHLILDQVTKKKSSCFASHYNIVVCHLGSGASVTAVVTNRGSMETSMGFTPLAGLMMGTRCGSIDPSIVGHACHVLDKTVDQVMDDLNKRSGLCGMMEDSAKSHDYDMRSLLKRQHDDDHAKLAVDMFVYRLAQHIASSMVALEGPLDALVFTAGIGEHSAEIRRRALAALQTSILQTVKLHPERNASDGSSSNGILSVDQTWPLVLDIPTDEEAMIGMECRRVLDMETADT